MKFVITFLFLALTSLMQSQNYSLAELEQLEDEALLEYFSKVSSDSLVGEQVARVYLDRGKKEGDTIKMARGYDRLARIFHPEKNIMFADSLIELTKNKKHKTYPALGYIIKSFEYHFLNDLILSSEYAYKGYEVALENNNILQIIYISDRLIYNKSIWGDKKEALNLQKSRHKLMSAPDFFDDLRHSKREGLQNNIQEVYLYNEISSIQNFIFCYLNLRQLDSAKLYLERGLIINEEYQGLHKDSSVDWFNEVSVEIDYYSGEFEKVIRKSDSLLRNEKTKLTMLSVFNFNIFKGFSYLKLNDLSSGIRFLKFADSLNDANNFYLQPYQRELFEQLLNYNTSNGNTVKQIEYLNKLIYTDSIFKINYRYFEPNIIQKFETPWLLKEKEELIERLESRNQVSKYILWVVSLLLASGAIVLVSIFKKKIRYKKRFLLLVNENSKSAERKERTASGKPEIGAKIIDDILRKLEQFENDKKYLSQNTSLQKLASKFKTNTKYLSNVINLEKEKTFPQYINDLRVEFALKEITENSRFRKYTIKAIAMDCGFNSAESFSTSFLKKHKVSATYYIKKIEKLKIKK
jgi:AraC-like DNA-binding protein